MNPHRRLQGRRCEQGNVLPSQSPAHTMWSSRWVLSSSVAVLRVVVVVVVVLVSVSLVLVLARCGERGGRQGQVTTRGVGQTKAGQHAGACEVLPLSHPLWQSLLHTG